MGGIYCTVAGKTALSIAKEVCTNAAATIAAGACAWYGGLVAEESRLECHLELNGKLIRLTPHNEYEGEAVILFH